MKERDVLSDGILVADGTFVPTIRNTLVARLVCEISRLPRDSEEGLEGLSVEVALWVFGGMVGHHGGWEGETGRGDEYSGKLGEEEVGVRLDGVVEARLTEWEEGAVLLWCGLLIRSEDQH